MSGYINTTFPTTDVTLQSGTCPPRPLAKAQLPETDPRPPREHRCPPSLTNGSVHLDGQGELSTILTASLQAEQATTKTKSRWATPSTSRSDDEPAPGLHQVTRDGTL